MNHDFTVWAPAAERVELVMNEERRAMTRARGGWWRCPVDVPEDAAAGYAFALDGGAPRPDPRSAAQPLGVHGPSALVDHAAFSWTDTGWRGLSARGAVLYEMHVGTFTPGGTFDAAIERLDHLVELGIDAVEVMPIAEFAGSRGWGYDGVALFAPHHAYGGPDGFKRFVDACHKSGLGVVLDVIYNHLGPAGNYLPEFGPYFSDRHQTNWGAAINFDGPGSDEVRRFVIDNALMWLRDYHVDGLRLDAVHAIVDDSAMHVLEQMAVEVDALAVHVKRPLFLIAESDLNDPRFVRSRDAGGYGLDAAWADEWHHALHAALTGETQGYYEDFGSLELLGKALRQAWVYDGTWSPHRGRVHGRPPAGLSGHQFVVSAQNHDQVGNRAVGERLGALVRSDRLFVAAALLLTAPFTPLLFQGEEWGASTPFQYFTDHASDLGATISEGRREEFSSFGWNPVDVPDPQDPATFEASKLCWEECDETPHRELLDWYRLLLQLRREHAALADPRLTEIEVQVDEPAQTIAVRRGPCWVLVNLGEHEHTFSVGRTVRMLAGHGRDTQVSSDKIVVSANGVAIVTAASSDKG